MIANFLLKIDRSIRYTILRKNIFYIRLDNCIDDFGNTYGKNGNHFFVKALNEDAYEKNINKSLKKYYKNNNILSINRIIKKKLIKSHNNKFFFPWERNRERDLNKFLKSHKIGPTPDIYIKKITERLLKTFKSIDKYGFHPFIYNIGFILSTGQLSEKPVFHSCKLSSSSVAKQ